jgi:hypothetical protein
MTFNANAGEALNTTIATIVRRNFRFNTKDTNLS